MSRWVERFMAKGKKQTAAELVDRYSQETVSLAMATTPVSVGEKSINPLLESLRRNVNRVVNLPVNILQIEENVRRIVDEDSPEFLTLVDSIREQGVRQNIIVDLQDADEENFRVVVIAGQRRTLAAKRAGNKQVAALVLRLVNRGERLLEGLAENLLREDLHCLDQAEAYAALIEEGWTEAQIADKFDRRRRTVLQFLRLAKYPETAKMFIRAHREAFTTYLLFNKFVAKSWKSEDALIQALQQVVAGKEASRKKKEPTPTREALRLAQSISRYNGLSCNVKGTQESGRVVITYQNRAAFEKVVSLFEQD